MNLLEKVRLQLILILRNTFALIVVALEDANIAVEAVYLTTTTDKAPTQPPHVPFA